MMQPRVILQVQGSPRVAATGSMRSAVLAMAVGLVFVPVLQGRAAAKIGLAPGCYRFDPPANGKGKEADPDRQYLVDGLTSSSYHVHVARFGRIPTETVTFDLSDAHALDEVAVWTVFDVSQGPDEIGVQVSTDGRTFESAGAVDCSQEPKCYPESKAFHFKIGQRVTAFRVVVTATKPSFQLCEVQAFGRPLSEAGGILAGGPSGADSEQDSSRNLVRNSALAGGHGWNRNGPAEWKLWGDLEWEKSGGPDGAAFISVSDPTKELTMRQFHVTLDPAKTYTLSAYLKSEAWSRHRSGLTVVNNGWKWEAPLLKPDDADSDWQRCSATFTPQPSDDGSHQIVFYALPPMTGKLLVSRVQLEEGGEASAYVETRPAGDIDENTAKALLSFATPAVSPDVVTLLNFAALRGTKVPDHGFRLILDLPTGIDLVAAATQNSKREFDKVSLVREGRAYCRHAIHARRWPTKYQGALQVYLRTSLPVGGRAKGYYHLRWEGGEQKETAFDIDVIRIPRARVPEKFLNIMCIYDGGTANWPDLAASLKHLGFNGAEICADVREDRIKPVVADLKREALFISNGRWDHFNPLASGITKASPEDAWAVDLAGKRSKKMPCPSYRATPPPEVVAYFRDAMKAGISWFNFDEEYNYSDKGCFCQRCKTKFTEYLAKRAPGLPCVDPVEIYRRGKPEGTCYQHWLQFRADLTTEWYANVRKVLQREFDGFPADSFNSAPEPGLLLSNYIGPSRNREHFLRTGHDIRAESAYFNYFMPMSYTGFTGRMPSIGATDIRPSVDEVPERNRIFSAGDVGDAWGLLWMCASTGEPDVYSKYYLLEAVAGGAKGHFVCKWVGFSGWDAKYLAETITALVPLENMIMAARPAEVEGLKKHERTNVHAVRAGDEMLVCVSNYPRGEMIGGKVQYDRPWIKDAVEVRVPLNSAGLKAVDVMTGERVPLQAGKLSVSLDKEMCRLVYVGKNPP